MSDVEPGSLAWHEQRVDDIENRQMRAGIDPQLFTDLDILIRMYRTAIAGWRTDWRLQPSRMDTLNRIEAAVRMCYPDDMTPNAKRVFESIIEDERGKSRR